MKYTMKADCPFFVLFSDGIYDTSEITKSGSPFGNNKSKNKTFYSYLAASF
jgi:hypothetical protein